MKKLTKKQRGEIYLKVADDVANNVGVPYLCWKLCDIINEPRINDTAEANFEEFRLFRATPKITELWAFSDQNERIICMLLCAEMCKDGK